MPDECRWLVATLTGALYLAAGGALAQHDSDPPDDAFLEFLGTWEDSEGNWLDPLQFESLGKRGQAPEMQASGKHSDTSVPEQYEHVPERQHVDVVLDGHGNQSRIHVDAPDHASDSDETGDDKVYDEAAAKDSA